jgi:Outer membrane protein beta-barrel domain
MMNQNDLENKGWDAMFQTLEREMPVEKKRRGGLWLWLCVGGLMLAGGAFLYFKMVERQEKTSQNVSKPIVYDSRLDNQTDKNAVEKTTQLGEATFRKFLKFPKSDTSVKMKGSKIVFEKSLKVIENNINTALQTNNNQINDFKIQDIKTPAIENKALVTDKKTLEKLSELSLWDSTNRDKMEIVSRLDAANKFAESVYPLSIKQDSSLKLDIKPYLKTILKPKKTSHSLIWGLAVGANAKNLQSFDGFQTGLIVGKPLSKKWAMSTGLNFRQSKMTQQNTSYLSFNSDRLSSTYNTNTLQKAVSVSVDKLYYLDMPTTIDYKINKKLAVASGLKLSYLIGQSTKTDNTSVYFVDQSGSSSKMELLNVVKTSTLGLNRWDAALMGGVKYLPTRHFELGLKYDFGLFNINNRGNFRAFNRYLGLNGVYWF